MNTTRVLLISNPRTGSTLLASLLRNHRDISIGPEWLNEEHGITSIDIALLERRLSAMSRPIVGFKCTPQQLVALGQTVASLACNLNITHVIVVWRESLLEMYASQLIAEDTNVWYSSEPATQTSTVHVDVERYLAFRQDTERAWQNAALNWPLHLIPIFVKYEDLIRNRSAEMKRILLTLSVDPSDYEFETEMCRQNPAPLDQKITNWNDLPEYIRSATIDIPHIVNVAIAKQVPVKYQHLVPDREPPVPPDGWRYRVGEPYLPPSVIDNVQLAINTKDVSSAGSWPKKLAAKLRAMFQYPVAQTCSSGFGALVLTLMAAGIGKDDEIIIPTFTMIAVANAVQFVGARPIPVDNAPDDYNPGLHEIRQAASDTTKAVIVTHTYGVPTNDIDLIAALCTEMNWILIEDISECAGIVVEANNESVRLLGTFGDFACASMYANKMIHAGDGGFVIARNQKYANDLSSLVNHGFERSFHFVHCERAANFKISGLSAALACSVVDSVDHIMQQRRYIAQTYRRYLAGSPLELMPTIRPYDTPWVFGVLCSSKSERSSLRSFLAAHSIETRNFFFPIHAQPAYADSFDKTEMKWPNAERLSEKGVYLPTFTELNEESIKYVCGVIMKFFGVCNFYSSELPASPKPTTLISISTQNLNLQVHQYSQNVGVSEATPDVQYCIRSAVSLLLEAEKYLRYESWDWGQDLLKNFTRCISDCQSIGFEKIEQLLVPYSRYIKSQEIFEPSLAEPWTGEDIVGDGNSTFNSIPTTTEHETLQLLSWLVRTLICNNILEVGAWLGRSTAVMATAAKQVCKEPRLYAVDLFSWRQWMRKICKLDIAAGASFLWCFNENILSVNDVVIPVACNVLKDAFVESNFSGVLFDLVYLDFTDDPDEMDQVWQQITPSLVDGVSVVVINPVSTKTIQFIVKYQSVLQPIAKPANTRAKAFKYAVRTSLFESRKYRRQLRFLAAPEWNHHQYGSFNVAIESLKSELHSSEADVDFIAAIEQFLCDYPGQIQRPWIGIVHSLPYNQFFYVPDLNRLCSRRYSKIMKMCCGLFTLTTAQAEFLGANLKAQGIHIPICTLKLPIVSSWSQKTCSSNVMELLATSTKVDVVFIGSFDRDFEYFFRVELAPERFRKVLLIGDAVAAEWSRKAGPDVLLLDRVAEDAYESLLFNSIVFLALQHGGAANTVLLECISRSVPILVPNIDSCVEYIGSEYPLLYHAGCKDLSDVLTGVKIQAAINYLQNYDKEPLSVESFCRTIQSSSVLCSLPLNNSVTATEVGLLTTRFDITVCVCSYRRTHHLHKIIQSLFDEQNFAGSIEIIVWNNNEARKSTVLDICKPYCKRNSRHRHLEVISSTVNHYCIVRACMTHLMHSEVLLICDDDVIPQPDFVVFFSNGHAEHRNDIIGVRGHEFLPHQLDHHNPKRVWSDYKFLRFIDDQQPEQMVHFLHADACLIPREALREFCSVAMPDEQFVLVDDYWMCYVLNFHFNRKFRKMSCTPDKHFTRTPDSDQEGLALYTQAEVRDTRIRMYIYHMLRGWPVWPEANRPLTAVSVDLKVTDSDLHRAKLHRWKKPFWGYNVSIQLTSDDVVALKESGAKIVRIGAVGFKEPTEFEINELHSNSDAALRDFITAVDLLSQYNIGVIITLCNGVASSQFWTKIASECAKRSNVIGYDLLNEPFTQRQCDMHYCELTAADDSDDHTVFFNLMTEYWQAIRRVDGVTPVVVEPTFWAKPRALAKISSFVDSLSKQDTNIRVSVHFYEPRMLVSRSLNKGKFSFPGTVPLYKCADSEQEIWNDESVGTIFDKILRWQVELQVPIFVGEFGIPRETRGAANFLRAVGKACWERRISCLVYSWRDDHWDAMNYELGPELHANILNVRVPLESNPLMKELMDLAALYNE